MCFLLMCFFLHHGHTCGCPVSGFLAVGAGESGSATLTPSPFANMDAALNVFMPSAHWLKATHGCVAYQAMCPHSVFVRASPRSDDLADLCSLAHSWAFLGFLHVETRFREKGLICTNLLLQYESEIHTQTWQLGSAPASVI